jgi:hypothetical protein
MMPESEYTWPAEAFDAISILAHDGQFRIEGTEGDQVQLEGDWTQFASGSTPEPQGRWLRLQLWQPSKGRRFTLRLPKRKAWVVELSAARGRLEANDLQARLQVMLQKGDIRVEDFRGSFNLMSGQASVTCVHCTESDMPEAPPLPEGEEEPQATPVGEGTAAAGEFHFGGGRSYPAWDWLSWAEEDWAAWGMRISQQAMAWAQQFSHLPEQWGWWPRKAGFNLNAGKGSVRLEQIEAKACAVNLGKGDVKLEQGRIGRLVANTAHGDIKCESIMPEGNWAIKTRHGDIQLSLPSEAQVRLDVATRHGDIHTQVPLIRVPRPGPEARRGGRMVGSLGQAGETAAQVGLATMNGNIVIDLLPGRSPYAGQPAQEKAAATAPPAALQPAAASPASAETELPEDGSPASPAQPAYDSQLAILQALSERQISVDEAEQLLRSFAP